MASSIPEGEDVRIVLIGKTGVGKSAVGNTILGLEKFKACPSDSSVTDTCVKHGTIWNNRVITVVDTPGILDTEKSAKLIENEIVKCVKFSCPGPHVFLLVVQLGRFTREEKNSVEALQKLFGKKADKHMILLFTHGDKLKDRTIKKYVQEASGPLQDVIKRCGGRFHAFNNDKIGDRKQVVELIKMIDNMVAENGGECYTDEIFKRVQSVSQKTVSIEALQALFGEDPEFIQRVLDFLKLLNRD